MGRDGTHGIKIPDLLKKKKSHSFVGETNMVDFPNENYPPSVCFTLKVE